MESILKGIEFGNETADDSNISELLPYFVEQTSFQDFVQPRMRVKIATAKKGVGKSALIQWAAYSISARDPDSLVIKCRGADLAGVVTSLSGSLNTPNDHIRHWMIRLCTLANRQLANRLSLALSDDAITIVESAEIDGFKSRNLVGCLLDRLHRLLPSSSMTKVPVADQVSILRRAKRPQIWFLVDDLDATFQNTSRENIDLGTFFTACRYLTQDMEDIYFRITMRSDVWSVIRRFDESLDKIEQYVDEIVWPLSEFRRLLFLRIRPFCKPAPSLEHSVSIPEEALHRRYFDQVFVPRMPWGNKEQETYRVIYTLSYERPRWAIQLCKLAQASAIEDRHVRIQKDNIDEVWGEYGAKRIKDLVAEHKHQCPEIEELLSAFRGCERLLTRDELFAWINNRVATHMAPQIEGAFTHSPREIGHFLYRIGFILARSDGDDESYQHYHFSEMPDFLTARTDQDFALKWEIHPCYREALDIKKLDQSHRRGFRKRRRNSF